MEEIIEEVKTQEELIQELDELNRLAIDEANKPKILSVEEIKAQKMTRMQKIFVEKAYEIKSIGLEKTGTNEYLDSQYETYTQMYQNAIGKTDDVSIAIIAKHEAQIALTASLLLQVQGVRSSLENSISLGVDINTILDSIEGYTLSLEDCDPIYFANIIKQILG